MTLSPSTLSPSEARWQQELHDLAALVPRTDGKFEFETILGGVRLYLHCRSPVRQEDGEVVIAEWRHVIDLLRPPQWPARRPLLRHREPVGVLHPNIFYPTSEETVGQVPDWWQLGRGIICYSQSQIPAVQLRLVHIVETVWDMLGYRWGKYSRSRNHCLAPTAVRWLNNTLASSPELIPTERRPLVGRPAEGHQHREGPREHR